MKSLCPESLRENREPCEIPGHSRRCKLPVNASMRLKPHKILWGEVASAGTMLYNAIEK